MTSIGSHKGVRSPLQLFGLYLAWAESALAVGLFATTGTTHWTRHFLMFVMALGLFAWVGVAGFLVVYLVIKKPSFLFNPSDYDRSVQHLLFPRESQIQVQIVEGHALEQVAANDNVRGEVAGID